MTASINTASDSLFNSLADQTVSVTVNDDDMDLDQDGVPDEDDIDDDNDGTPDNIGPNPLFVSASDDTLGGEAEAGAPITMNILSNDDFIPRAGISIVDIGNGTATGNISFDAISGELTYTPEATEQDQLVTIEYEGRSIRKACIARMHSDD